jgi:hypothetical protein
MDDCDVCAGCSYCDPESGPEEEFASEDQPTVQDLGDEVWLSKREAWPINWLYTRVYCTDSALVVDGTREQVAINSERVKQTYLANLNSPPAVLAPST